VSHIATVVEVAVDDKGAVTISRCVRPTRSPRPPRGAAQAVRVAQGRHSSILCRTSPSGRYFEGAAGRTAGPRSSPCHHT
jgi:hypothetical protein